MKVHIPQLTMIEGEAPYNLAFYGGSIIDSFMISTGIKVPYILKRFNNLEARGDEFIGTWKPRVELLFGFGKHEPILREWGSQPFNTYLVGHFAAGPNALKDPDVQRFGRFVRVQQYFRAGFWGLDPPVPGWKYSGVSIVKEQLEQDLVGIPLLFELGILKPDTLIYFADQSADKPCPHEFYFNLFKGPDWLKKYFEWLPAYFRRCRSDHFNIPIEEVIKSMPEAK